jgi:CheY-like chemotaxis protein
MGIDPQFLPHVFEYFRQADSTTTRSFGGLGLGLAIVRYLTELHGGTVRVDSEGVGGGATFTVMLPRRGMSAEMIDEGIVPPQSFTLEGMKVLVVDDEADSRELVSAILQNYGAQVQVEASGTAALQAIPTFQPDVLVSDIAMPEMDGYMLLRQVRALAPDAGGEIPAIALTAYAGDRDRDRILEAGFAQHVAKPIDAEALVAAISLSVRTHTP